ncbi:hypothetical protein A3K63_03710 [Candidatus Micrarchaeota archaeon RBG_16_49_10]|nr:MAG: hypothetical protein A3K63_03710 [Candidatus Micrarchaeota archaeon RBG_16_49_10]
MSQTKSILKVMSLANVKCPKCKKQVPKRVLKLTHGKCNSCGFMLASSLTRFTTARDRIKSKYTK